jgi:methylated-DNA-protein-cysteine methyltransferase related protein
MGGVAKPILMRGIQIVYESAGAGARAMSWERVYRLVKRIPQGRVMTYGSVAKALRLRGGARAAGYALAACPGGRGIPWHRVVGAGGRIRLPEPQAALQRRLLEGEKVTFRGGAVDMKQHAWPPAMRRSHQAARGGGVW